MLDYLLLSEGGNEDIRLIMWGPHKIILGRRLGSRPQFVVKHSTPASEHWGHYTTCIHYVGLCFISHNSCHISACLGWNLLQTCLSMYSMSMFRCVGWISAKLEYVCPHESLCIHGAHILRREGREARGVMIYSDRVLFKLQWGLPPPQVPGNDQAETSEHLSPPKTNSNRRSCPWIYSLYSISCLGNWLRDVFANCLCCYATIHVTRRSLVWFTTHYYII